MKIFPWQKRKDFFSDDEKKRIVTSIQDAERETSGEVRVFIETKCRYVNALDRAHELFFQFEMQLTELRNASLIYIAVGDKQAAVFGDEGIFQQVGDTYWENEVNQMLSFFKQDDLAGGICAAIADLGVALHQYFPYDPETDKNELPDEIIFGN